MTEASLNTVAKKSVRVLLVEDHELTRQGLAYGLGKYTQIQVAGEAENGEEAIQLIEQHRPQVILMDIVMPVLNGIHATQKIRARWPEIKIIMLTSHGEKEKVFEAFAAGVDGYCMKDVKTDRLVQIIEMVLDGVIWFDPEIAEFILKVIPLISDALIKATAREKEIEHIDLTAREKEILKLMADGEHNKAIAEQLHISLFTVKNHVSSIIHKLSVDDRTQAAVLALKKGLV